MIISEPGLSWMSPLRFRPVGKYENRKVLAVDYDSYSAIKVTANIGETFHKGFNMCAKSVDEIIRETNQFCIPQ